jgi:hypothetical protein
MRRGCRMLGRTQRVTAPTGLPKVMESAVGRAREPRPMRGGLDRARLALRRCCLDRAPTGGSARALPGAPMQRLGRHSLCASQPAGVVRVRARGASGRGWALAARGALTTIVAACLAPCLSALPY